MLTKLVERGVERCTQYWPEKLNISETYGDFEVTMKDQQKCITLYYNKNVPIN